MNEAMKIENIEQYMEQLDIDISQNFIYAYTQPGLFSSMVYGAFSPLVDMKNFLIFFYPQEIILVALTLTGKFSETEVHIPRRDIDFIKIKKGLIQYKIQLKVEGDKKLAFRSNKFIAGAKWQKNNLEFLEMNNWYE